MAHTPGPWEYVPHDTLTGGTIIAPSQSPDGLSEIIAHSLNNPKPADMSLIAAAPEMLEACTVTAKAIDSALSKEGLAMAITQLLPVVRDAIAKATGGE